MPENKTDRNFTVRLNISEGDISSDIQWGLLSFSGLFVTVSSLTLNLSLMSLFRDKRLFTPFNIYIFSLLTANVSVVCINGPFEFLDSLYSAWSFGTVTCTLYLYAGWVLQLVQQMSHALISLNRLWAVTFPHSYRRRHSVKIAVILCGWAWIYGHVLAFPWLLLDVTKYRRSEAVNGCEVNSEVTSQNTWEIIIAFCYLCHLIFILVAFLVIALKEVKTRKISFWRAAAYGKGSTGPMETKTEISTKSPVIDGRRPGQSCKISAIAGKEQRRRSNGFTLLVLLTSSICVFWTPDLAYFTVVALFNIRNMFAENLVSMLIDCQCLIDPILFALSVGDLREKIQNCFASLRRTRCKING